MKCFKWTIWSVMTLLALSSSLALSDELENKPIARVFDQLITDADITQNKEVLDRYRAQFSKDEFDKWEKEYKIKALEALVYSALQKQLLEEMDMEPSEDDIQLFIDFSRKKQETQLEEFQTQREGLLKELQAANLEESKRASLKDHLKTIDQLIAFELKAREEEKTIPNYEQIKKRSLKRVATVSVTSWKFNKALYTKYGGRVIFQQAGFEPIDAYKSFLEGHKASKNYEIMDPAIE